MSVQVSIDIANGSAHRHLSIERQSEPRLDEDGHRDLTDIGEYAVILGGHHGQSAPIATFHHRYGEDVLALITSAIAALRHAGVERA